MEMEVEYLEPQERKHGKDKKPTIITWKDTQLVRGHSIRAVANEIANASANQDLISINIIGKQSTGKTELFRTLAHLIHQFADEYYSVLEIGRKEFVNLEDTISKLKPTNYIIGFDDLAFLKASATTKQIDQMQYILSVIRHLPHGKDVKIIIFKSFQYSKSIPPFLRQNDMTLISSVDANEFDNMVALLGRNSATVVSQLQKMQVQVKLGKANNAWFTYPLNAKMGKFFKYHAKHPFLPYIYFNGIFPRIVVSPLRKWIDPVCPVCDHARDDSKMQQTLQEFKVEFEAMYNTNRGSGKSAIKKMLANRGIETHGRTIQQAEKKLLRFMEETGATEEQIQELFEIPTVRTRAFSKRRDNVAE